MGTSLFLQPITSPIKFTKMKLKKGTIKHPDHSPTSVIVEGLSLSLEGAKLLIGLHCESPFGEILRTFGSKGNLEVNILNNSSKIEKGQEVLLKIYKHYFEFNK
jgi:hypothetical protein